jgi:hypothetical protein
MLTRRYYNIIAKAIKTSGNMNGIVRKLCEEFKQDNPNFNENKFKEACGCCYD